MEEITSSTIICPQCAGENKIPTDERFLECEFCGSAIYIDKRKVVNHYLVTSNFNQEQAIGNVRRWMAGNFHVKDLDKDAQISTTYFYYFPLWYFKTKEANVDKIHLQPAYSTPISEIKSIQIPAGNLKVFHKKEYNIKDFITPDVLYDSAKSWLTQTGVKEDTIQESNLVHIPFYQTYYNYKGSQYTAMVEASSGKVYANIWPAKSEVPFRMLFGASIFAFFIVSILSFIIAFFALGSSEGYEAALLTGEVIKIFGYFLVSLPLIFIAYLIAKKV